MLLVPSLSWGWGWNYDEEINLECKTKTMINLDSPSKTERVTGTSHVNIAIGQIDGKKVATMTKDDTRACIFFGSFNESTIQTHCVTEDAVKVEQLFTLNRYTGEFQITFDAKGPLGESKSIYYGSCKSSQRKF